MKVSRGDIFEQVFVDESVNLHLIQEVAVSQITELYPSLKVI